MASPPPQDDEWLEYALRMQLPDEILHMLGVAPVNVPPPNIRTDIPTHIYSSPASNQRQGGGGEGGAGGSGGGGNRPKSWVDALNTNASGAPGGGGGGGGGDGSADSSWNARGGKGSGPNRSKSPETSASGAGGGGGAPNAGGASGETEAPRKMRRSEKQAAAAAAAAAQAAENAGNESGAGGTSPTLQAAMAGTMPPAQKLGDPTSVVKVTPTATITLDEKGVKTVRVVKGAGKATQNAPVQKVQASKEPTAVVGGPSSGSGGAGRKVTPSAVMFNTPGSGGGGTVVRPTHMMDSGPQRPLNLPPELSHLTDINPRNFELPTWARYHVIKSYSEDDIHKSIKYSVWASTESGNRRLAQAWREAQGKGDVWLFFSVNGSGQFCGCARMTSAIDVREKLDCWADNFKWSGKFNVKWVFIKDIPNNQFRHIILENNEGKPVTNSRDTQEVPPEKGREIMSIFRSYRHKTSILDDFSFYEQRTQQAAQQAGERGGSGSGPSSPTSPDADRPFGGSGGAGGNPGLVGGITIKGAPPVFEQPPRAQGYMAHKMSGGGDYGSAAAKRSGDHHQDGGKSSSGGSKVQVVAAKEPAGGKTSPPAGGDKKKSNK